MGTQNTEASPTIEVHLEELGANSWVNAWLNTITGSYGSVHFRFAARAAGRTAHAASDCVATSATFLALGSQDLNDVAEPNGGIGLARNELAALDDELVRAGWRRRPDAGRHWWSRTYDAPPRESGDVLSSATSAEQS